MGLGRKDQSNCMVFCVPWEVHRDQNSRHSFVFYSLRIPGVGTGLETLGEMVVPMKISEI